MSQRARLLVVVGGIAVLLIGAGAVFALRAMLRYQAEHAPPPPIGFVPARFEQVRESPGHQEHFEKKEVGCRDCHALGEGGFQAPTAVLCDKCHPIQRVVVHERTPLAAASTDCLSCHRFGDDRRIQRHNCARCHSEARGFIDPIEVHAKADCTQCHNVHKEPWLLPRDCVDCHDDKQPRHGDRVVGDASTCNDCHQVHDKAAAADGRCADCHRRGRAKVATSATFQGHPKCVSCHKPHDFSAAGAKACTSCHGDQLVMGAAEAREHARCDRCHEPHRVERSADRSCTRCHSRVSPGHPPDENERACLGCHPIHPDALLANNSATCWSCHKQASSATSFHDTKTGKTRCMDCHEKHAFSLKGAGVALCTDCHEPQVRDARKTKGHDQCFECHATAAHEPAKPVPACRQCHQPQASTAPKGHDVCTECHGAKHDARVRRDKTCKSCHKEQARGAHARVDKGCLTCHRAHGPRGVAEPEPCVSCHARAKLPGLHQVEEHHDDCARCHEAHEKHPKRDRKSCISDCHEKQQNHEPKAAVCSGCHPFRSGRPVHIKPR